MASFKEIKGTCPSRNKYANGGAVSTSRKAAKTVINIVTAPPAAPVAGGMSAAPGPAAPMGNSPSPAGPPVPPAAAAMALSQMQGKPGVPGAFKRGGRVLGGVSSGNGRLATSRAEAKVPKRPSATPDRGSKKPRL